ncbi:hypothetical protein BDV93DRAFT_546527 [Ceratobasidium sp. AG-I]|nr:hypothetical protein BDV93DRAFT_546527 [Ceratobasidium sp. AG-I]
MRGSISFAVAAMALCGSALGAKKLPAYRHLYSYNLTLSENHPIVGPLGTRWGLSILGGTMKAPNDTIIAKAVPGVGGETGIIDKNNDFQIDARAFFQFLDDGKYAYILVNGIGPLTGQLFDSHRIETDSPSRLAWNGYHIVANNTLTPSNNLLTDAFTFSV